MMGKNNSTDNIRERMFHEMEDKHIFNLIMEYAFEYADNSPDRNVFPTPEDSSLSVKALKRLIKK